MGNVLTWKEVEAQSNQVFGQFGESHWLPYAKQNVKLPRRSTDELQNVGVGKFLLLAALGESLEKNIETIKKYRDRVDIVTCEKGFAHLYDRGIVADYVMVCDCNVLYDHIKDHIKYTKGVKLLATPYANPDYTKNWQGDRYFFINQDAIQTEKKFLEIFKGSGVRVIPAGSNVSNAMMVFFTGSNEYQNVNWSGYEQYIMVGYDYSWKPEGSYYAFTDPKPKRYYMHHRTVLDYKGDMCFTSENLWFSAKWAYTYITTFNLPVINCSERGLLAIGNNKQKPLDVVLSNINPSKESIDQCKDQFEALRIATLSQHQANKLFEKARGVRYGYR